MKIYHTVKMISENDEKIIKIQMIMGSYIQIHSITSGIKD